MYVYSENYIFYPDNVDSMIALTHFEVDKLITALESGCDEVVNVRRHNKCAKISVYVTGYAGMIMEVSTENMHVIITDITQHKYYIEDYLKTTFFEVSGASYVKFKVI